jgi:hypothetical protein
LFFEEGQKLKNIHFWRWIASEEEAAAEEFRIQGWRGWAGKRGKMR